MDSEVRNTSTEPSREIVIYKDVDLCRQELVVLRDVSFSVSSGEFVYLIGKVGSGKSTLLKSMYAEVPVVEGNAEVMEFNLRQLRRREIPFLRRRLGIVFQDFQLLPDRDVYGNLRFVLEATGWENANEIDTRIQEVLDEVGMSNKSYKFPYALSGGEQQRIAIARALLNKPDLILADEPTGNLDTATADQIMKRLYEISRKGTPVIMATHNLTIQKQYPGRVIECVDKKVKVL